MIELMTNGDYHAHQAVGSTLLKDIADKSVLHAIKREFSQSDAMVLGSALHCKVLEPEVYDSLYFVAPEINKRTKAGKELWALLEKQNEGKDILSAEQGEHLEGMFKALKAHKIAWKLLTGGSGEYSYFAKCPDTGLELKCRPDYEVNGVLVDLKTTFTASPDGFLRKGILERFYHLQAAYYIDVYNMAMQTRDPNHLPTESFYFVAVENKAPYAVGVYTIDEIGLGAGRALYKNSLAEYKLYLDRLKKDPDYVPGYSEDALELEVPLWALQKAEDRIKLGGM